jgi:hypothetical protein
MSIFYGMYHFQTLSRGTVLLWEQHEPIDLVDSICHMIYNNFLAIALKKLSWLYAAWDVDKPITSMRVHSVWLTVLEPLTPSFLSGG